MQSLSRRRAPTLSRHCDAWPSAGSSGRRGHRGRRGACLDLPLPGGGPGSGRVAVQPDQLISSALDGPIDYSWTSEATVPPETIAGALSYRTGLMVERADAQEPPRSKSDPPPCPRSRVFRHTAPCRCRTVSNPSCFPRCFLSHCKGLHCSRSARFLNEWQTAQGNARHSSAGRSRGEEIPGQGRELMLASPTTI